MTTHHVDSNKIMTTGDSDYANENICRDLGGPLTITMVGRGADVHHFCVADNGLIQPYPALGRFFLSCAKSYHLLYYFHTCDIN